MRLLGAILNLVSYVLAFSAGGDSHLAVGIYKCAGGLTPNDLMLALS